MRNGGQIQRILLGRIGKQYIRQHNHLCKFEFIGLYQQQKKEPLPISSFMMGLSGSLFISYIRLHQRVGFGNDTT